MKHLEQQLQEEHEREQRQEDERQERQTEIDSLHLLHSQGKDIGRHVRRVIDKIKDKKKKQEIDREAASEYNEVSFLGQIPAYFNSNRYVQPLFKKRHYHL